MKLPTKFDPRKKSLEKMVPELDNNPPSDQLVNRISSILQKNRNLASLELLTELMPAGRGMRYDEASLLRRASKRMRKAFQVADMIGEGEFHNILEIGCGRGETLLGIDSSKGAKYVGLDISSRLFPSNNEFMQLQSVNFIEASAKEIPLQSCSIDLVVSFNVLEHLLYIEYAINEISRVLRPGGVFFTQFGPPWNAPFGAHLKRFTTIPYIHHIFPEDVVARFTNRQCAYETLNRLHLENYRNILWQNSELICLHYWEHLNFDYSWIWKFFIPEAQGIALDERVVTQIDVGLAKRENVESDIAHRISNHEKKS